MLAGRSRLGVILLLRAYLRVERIGVWMRGAYAIASAATEHVSCLPAIERAASALFRDVVPTELLEHASSESDYLVALRDGTLWVALGPDDQAVGFVCAAAAGERVHLTELDVLPAHGRRGIGTELVRRVEAWAGAGGYREVTLTTYRDLPWNAPFYLQLGFEIVPEVEWDAHLRSRFDQEAGLESERQKRVAMRKRLQPRGRE